MCVVRAELKVWMICDSFSFGFQPFGLSVPTKGCSWGGYELKLCHKIVSPSDLSLDMLCGFSTPQMHRGEIWRGL